MLEYVNHVYVLIDSRSFEKSGAPRFFDYDKKNITVITSKDLGVHEGNEWVKLARMHKIPGLSDYFLWAPDDNFMNRKFQMSDFWSKSKNAPKLHSYGSWLDGWCDGQGATGATHGPVLIQKCAMSAVLEAYLGGAKKPDAILKRPVSKQLSVILKTLKTQKPIDTLCLFTHAMSNEWENDGYDTSFHDECHTNGGCNLDSSALFLNIQGPGISDEYGGTSHGLFAKFGGPAKYFASKYPTPSRFESNWQADKGPIPDGWQGGSS